ncbi:hypothetical protein P3T37_000771 [Kitasatospora sp. MAA4]|nr:hypothetical protein [Kitasatospora sp. MAA4]MDH6131402.1 hypothetical protein [Kitasatospora sp. MAA4]
MNMVITWGAEAMPCGIANYQLERPPVGVGRAPDAVLTAGLEA